MVQSAQCVHPEGGPAMKPFALPCAVLAVLLALGLLLPAYHATNLARILVLAIFATGYNLAFGTTGLLSLGHALYFAAGLYAAALGASLAGLTAGPGLVAGLAAGAATAALTGLLALRTSGVAFMIVTLMFAQSGYLTVIYFGVVTRGDEGFVLPAALRTLGPVNLAADTPRFLTAFTLYAAALIATLALTLSATGRVLVAVRENPERTRMLGYDPFRYRLLALTVSGALSGLAGAAYAHLFGYAGATFAATQYSILPLLWVLVGGPGTALGPLLGTAIMFYLVDLGSSTAQGHLLVVGIALLVLVLFAPRGILGTLAARDRL
jgi:branched-chain amino acid transport system permease protein